MARSGRSYTNRPIIARHPRTFDRLLTLGPFESVSEWPAIAVDTPNVNLFLGPFESVSEWPALGFVRDQIFTLPAFESVSEWPALTVSVPPSPGDAMSGADGELEWNGHLERLLAGGGQALHRITELEGWEDLPGIESGNTARPSRDGSYSGRKFAEERVVTATIQLDDNTGTFAQSLAFLRRATAKPEDDTEYPLVIRLRGETLLAYGAVTGRILPTGLVGAGLVQATIRWTCSDPRRYSLDLQGTTIPLGTPTDILNDGSAETHPLIRLAGPVTDPVLTNSTLDQVIAFDLEVPAGETLTLDTDNATATMGGDSQMSALTGASVPVGDFVLTAGGNTIAYTATSGGGEGADVLWRHAHL